MQNKSCFSLIVSMIIWMAMGCKYNKLELLVSNTQYPPNIENIVVNKCATAGCHNNISHDGAGGLNLASWDSLFEGSRGGAGVIPYRKDFSLLLYYTNVDSSKGLVMKPTMPYNNSSLTSDEYSALSEWILNGATNASGFVKYSDNPNRKKFYTACQGCDEVAVFDAKSMKAMRYVKVGVSTVTEAPHMIKVAPNNKFWCTVFLNSNYFQIYSTIDNSLIKQIDIGMGSWNTFAISNDSKNAFVVNTTNGNIMYLELETGTKLNWNFGLTFPHGALVNKTNDTLYVTSQQGAYIWKIPINDPSNYKQVNFSGTTHKFHEIIFSPDGSKYFLTAQNNSQVLAVNTTNDSIITTLSVGGFPQEMGVSESSPYLFVSCTEDNSTFAGKTGSVYVIDYNTMQIKTSIYAGHQTHGIAVDDENNRVYFSNRNVTTGGPAPHHISVCQGRNGYITALDINTLQLIPNYKHEVSVDPYGIDITH